MVRNYNQHSREIVELKSEFQQSEGKYKWKQMSAFSSFLTRQNVSKLFAED